MRIDANIRHVAPPPWRSARPGFANHVAALGRNWTAEFFVLGLIGFLSLATLIAIFFENSGYFAYSLDAPYVHLSLAEQIRAGHYGINTGENVAPSSSILFPFLLSLLSYAGFGQYSALAICFASTLAIGWLFCRLADEARIPFRRLSRPALLVASLAAILSLNLIGLEFTGLEHSLHTALALGSLLGCVRFVRRGMVDWWWLLCVVIQPLVRFEAVALLAIEVAILVVYGRYWHAIGVAAACVILIGGFAFYLDTLGLSLLPNSVLERSSILAAGLGEAAGARGNLAIQLFLNVKGNLVSYGGAQIAIVTAMILARLAGPGRADRVTLTTIAFAALVSLAQLTGGSFGSYSRYEIYVMAIDFAALAIVYRRAIASWCLRADLWRVALVAALVVFAFAGYARRSIATPAASVDVYDQQYQLQRYVTKFYRGPVAIDHIGWITYRNPYYVLDLYGVGSEDAHRAMHGDPPVEWMNRLARQHDIGLAIVYPNLNPNLPREWQPVAQMTLTGRNHTAAGPTVVFMAVRDSDRAKIARSLMRFEPTMPRGVALKFVSQP